MFNLSEADRTKVVQEVLQALGQQTEQQPLPNLIGEPAVKAAHPNVQHQSRTQPRVEFHGELRQLAQMVLTHLQCRALLDVWPDEEGEPELQELMESWVMPEIYEMLRSVKEHYGLLPCEVIGNKASVMRKCKMDVLILCHAVSLEKFTTADVLNSLLYMGYLGECLALEVFNSTVSALMAPDQKDADGKAKQNSARRNALTAILRRIEPDFHHIMGECLEKQKPRIKNPQQQREAVNPAYALKMFGHSTQTLLPF